MGAYAPMWGLLSVMPMTLDDVIAKLRSRAQSVPRPLPLPTPEQVEAVEAQLGVKFPADYVRYLLTASDVVFGFIEPATVANSAFRTHIPKVVASARAYGVPSHLLPICEDNADFYCLTPSGSVEFLSHNGSANESWPDLATWIEQVWIGEAE